MFSEFIDKRIITRIKEMALPVTEIKKNYLKIVDKHTGKINKDIDVLSALKDCSTINQLIEQGFCISLYVNLEKSRIRLYLIDSSNPSNIKVFSFPTDYFDDKEQYLEKYKQECITRSEETKKEVEKYLKSKEIDQQKLYNKYLKLKKEFENV